MSLGLYIVCYPLVSEHITSQTTPTFKSLDFEDHSDRRSTLRVDVLIGSDYYWELVAGSVCRSAAGPTAIHTKLGWVLSASNNSQCLANLVTTHMLRVDLHEQENMGLDEQL